MSWLRSSVYYIHPLVYLYKDIARGSNGFSILLDNFVV
jgi:hypothetical protein